MSEKYVVPSLLLLNASIGFTLAELYAPFDWFLVMSYQRTDAQVMSS